MTILFQQLTVLLFVACTWLLLSLVFLSFTSSLAGSEFILPFNSLVFSLSCKDRPTSATATRLPHVRIGGSIYILNNPSPHIGINVCYVSLLYLDWESMLRRRI